MAGRITKSIIDEIASELTNGQQQRLFRRMRYRAEKASRMALERVKAEAPGRNSPGQLPACNNAGIPIIEPSDVLLSKAVRTQVDVEEAISRIRERSIKADHAGHVLMTAIAQAGWAANKPTTTVVIKDISSDPDSEPDASSEESVEGDKP